MRGTRGRPATPCNTVVLHSYLAASETGHGGVAECESLQVLTREEAAGDGKAGVTWGGGGRGSRAG